MTSYFGIAPLLLNYSMNQLRQTFAPYIPSLEAYQASALQAARVASSYLPQKSGEETMRILNMKISRLQTLENRAAVENQIRKELMNQLNELRHQFQDICGTHFEDSSSIIHKAWMDFVQEESIYNASSSTPFDRSSLEANDQSLPVSQAFKQFLQLKTQSDEVFEKIVQLGSTFASDDQLRNTLKEEQKTALEMITAIELALPQREQEYLEALTNLKPIDETAALLDIWSQLKKQLAENIRTHYLLEKILNALADDNLSLNSLVTAKIEKNVVALQRLLALAENHVGVDWTQTGVDLLSYLIVPAVAHYYS